MQSFEECYELVTEYIKKSVSETSYNVFIRDIKPVSFDNDIATLSIPSDFLKKTVDERYRSLIEEGFGEILGFPVTVELQSLEALSSGRASPLHSLPPILTGEYAYTFDTFIVGANNRFAHAAAQAVAAIPAAAYNPLFIYGDSGLGKTHLLMAIKNDLIRTHPEFRVIYVESERFTNELISAIKAGNTEPFHDKYRSADVLLVDDVQFIGGKPSTEEEFFHAFNTLTKSGKQIVLSADRPPKEIKSLAERLRTRFESGLIADISAPDLETRIAILRRKADILGFQLPDAVADFIAEQLKDNIRQLEGIVKKLYAYYLMDKTLPTLETARLAIKDVMQARRPIPVTMDKIISEVSRTFNIPENDIRSPKRDADITNARQVSMYIIREVTGITLEDIGKEFSNRNHSTVTHALNLVSAKLKTDDNFKNTIEDIIRNAKS